MAPGFPFTAAWSNCRSRSRERLRSLNFTITLRRETKMQSVPKKIALVTGANKGIGFEVARQLAVSGCTVLLGARNPVLGEEAAAKLKRDDVRYLAIDLEDSATIAIAAQATDADFGHLDILVNNAGIAAQGDGLPSSVTLDAIE